MKIVYTVTALDDLAGIATYLLPRNPDAAERVAEALERTIARLSDHPFVGRAQEDSGVRKLVEPRFGYIVYYQVGEGVVFVLTIQHPSRERPFTDA